MPERRSFKRNRQLAFGALTLCLSIIFLGLSYVLPFSSLLVIVFIPFSTAILAYYSDFSEQIIFIVAIILVSLIDLQDGFFYLVPNTIIGLLYGNLVKFKIDRLILFSLTFSAGFLLSFLAVYPINLLFKTDLIAVFAKLFSLSPAEFSLIAPCFFLLLGLIQTLIMQFSVENEMKKFKMIAHDWQYQFQLALLLSTLFGALSYPLFMLRAAVGYVSLSYALIFSSFTFIFLLNTRHRFLRTVVGLSLLISLFPGLALMSVLPPKAFGLTMLLPVGAIIIDAVIFILFQRGLKHEKIDLESFDNTNTVVE